MKTTALLMRALFVALASGLGLGVGPAAAAAAKPNIILIVADDLGWADLEYQGPKVRGLHETPHLDRLAAEGMNLARFYPGASNCAPSRACYQTGMYPPRHHVYMAGGWTDRRVNAKNMRWKVPKFEADESFNTLKANITHIEPEWTSLAEMLKPGGYTSARIGKWHIGKDDQGFDVVTADGKPNSKARGSQYSDDAVTERLTGAAIDFITRHRDRPFFLYLAHYEPHGPLTAKADRIDYYRKKFASLGETERNPIFAAMVEEVDRSTGQLMAAVKALRLQENTLVLFTSDNGGWVDLPTTPNNYPLRGAKGNFYEGGIRTPAIVRWPGVIKPGSSSDYPVHGVDLMPTFAELAGVPVPATQPVDGVSVVPLLRGGSLPERAVFFHFPLYLGGAPLPVHGGRDNAFRAVPSTTVIRGDWKLIQYYEYERFELFNLRADIGEARDLSALRPDIAGPLLAELNAWTKRVNAPIPNVPNEGFKP